MRQILKYGIIAQEVYGNKNKASPNQWGFLIVSLKTL